MGGSSTVAILRLRLDVDLTSRIGQRKPVPSRKQLQWTSRIVPEREGYAVHVTDAQVNWTIIDRINPSIANIVHPIESLGRLRDNPQTYFHVGKPLIGPLDRAAKTERKAAVYDRANEVHQAPDERRCGERQQ